ERRTFASGVSRQLTADLVWPALLPGAQILNNQVRRYHGTKAARVPASASHLGCRSQFQARFCKDWPHARRSSPVLHTAPFGDTDLDTPGRYGGSRSLQGWYSEATCIND